MNNSLNRVDPNSKLGKAILQNKFKIPIMPKDSALEKVPTGVKEPDKNYFRQNAEGESGHHWWHHFRPVR